MNSIYLDNNATTFCDPRVIARMADLAAQCLGNPASQHGFGREARRVIEAARSEILVAVKARTAGMHADNLIFTSSGTEANNLAVFGLPESIAGEILVSSIEHPSILAAAELAKKRGRAVTLIPCLRTGVVDLNWLRHRIDMSKGHNPPVALVAVMAANNETGAIQGVEEIGVLCEQNGVRLHIDAVQCLSKVAVDFQAWRASSLTICAHKLHGPVGVGALIHRHNTPLEPQMVGGFQQNSLRAGTESVWLPDAFAYAIKLALEDSQRGEQLKELRDRFERTLLSAVKALNVDIQVLAHSVPRLPNTSCLAFPGYSRQALQMSLDLSGVACSTGSACESGSAMPSHVLQAMGVEEHVLQSALRFSFSVQSTEQEVDEAVERIVNTLRRLKR